MLGRFSLTAAQIALYFFWDSTSLEAAIDVKVGMLSGNAGNDTRSNPLNTNVSGSTELFTMSPAPLTEIPNVTPASMNVLTVLPTGVSIRLNLPYTFPLSSICPSVITIQAFRKSIHPGSSGCPRNPMYHPSSIAC